MATKKQRIEEIKQSKTLSGVEKAIKMREILGMKTHVPCTRSKVDHETRIMNEYNGPVRERKEREIKLDQCIEYYKSVNGETTINELAEKFGLQPCFISKNLQICGYGFY